MEYDSSRVVQRLYNSRNIGTAEGRTCEAAENYDRAVAILESGV